MRQEKNAIVNVYELSEEWDDFKVLSFEKEDEKWLDFVCACRKGQALNQETLNRLITFKRAYEVRNHGR